MFYKWMNERVISQFLESRWKNQIDLALCWTEWSLVSSQPAKPSCPISTELPRTVHHDAPLTFSLPNPEHYCFSLLLLPNKNMPTQPAVLWKSNCKVTISQSDQLVHAGVMAEPSVYMSSFSHTVKLHFNEGLERLKAKVTLGQDIPALTVSSISQAFFLCLVWTECWEMIKRK